MYMHCMVMSCILIWDGPIMVSVRHIGTILQYHQYRQPDTADIPADTQMTSIIVTPNLTIWCCFKVYNLLDQVSWYQQYRWYRPIPNIDSYFHAWLFYISVIVLYSCYCIDVCLCKKLLLQYCKTPSFPWQQLPISRKKILWNDQIADWPMLITFRGGGGVVKQACWWNETFEDRCERFNSH